MLNLNEAGEQSKGSRIIPPMSKVLVRLSIQAPAADSVGSAPELTRRASGLEQISAMLEVLAGTYKGAYFYHNFNVSGAQTDGQHKACDISMRHIRALVEAARGVSPKDASPYATQCRMLQSWSDINGLIFPVQVECEENLKGYINNTLKAIVTLDDADYQTLMTEGEILTDKPIPEAKNQGQAQAPKAPPAYAAPQTHAAPPSYQTPPKAAVKTPPWAMGAQPKAAPSFPPPPPMPPMPPLPEVPSYMQDIPFEGVAF